MGGPCDRDQVRILQKYFGAKGCSYHRASVARKRNNLRLRYLPRYIILGVGQAEEALFASRILAIDRSKA